MVLGAQLAFSATSSIGIFSPVYWIAMDIIQAATVFGCPYWYMSWS